MLHHAIREVREFLIKFVLNRGRKDGVAAAYMLTGGFAGPVGRWEKVGCVANDVCDMLEATEGCVA